MMKYNRIECCDCVDGVRSLAAGSVPLTVTSPPYDRIRKFAPFDFEALAHELFKVTCDGGVLVWVVGDQIVDGSETGTSFRQALFFKEVGFRLHHTMAFASSGTYLVTRTRYGSALQYMFVFSKGRPRTIRLIRDKPNKYAGQQQNVPHGRDDRNRNRYRSQPVKKFGLRPAFWVIATGKSVTTKDDYAYEHDAVMPESIARDHILTWSKPGELVLDVFVGSGTTAKMAALHGRKYLGFDIEKKWCDLAERRVREAVLGL